MYRRFFLIFLLLITVFALSGKDVSALTVISPTVEITAEPGEQQRGIVKVFNETSNDLVLQSSIEEFAAGDQSGAPVFISPEEAGEHVDWFSLDEEEITLRSRQAAVIPFTVDVPASATPGGYYTVIFWQPVPDRAVGAVGINGRVGTLVFLEVTGDVERSGEVNSFDKNPSSAWAYELPVNFQVDFENTGNIHLRPSGTITIRGALGQEEQFMLNVEKSSVLPGNRRLFGAQWGKAPEGSGVTYFWNSIKQEWEHLALGPFSATVSVSYDNFSVPVVQEIDFFFVPWRTAGIVAGFFFLLFLIRMRRRFKKKRSKK